MLLCPFGSLTHSREIRANNLWGLRLKGGLSTISKLLQCLRLKIPLFAFWHSSLAQIYEDIWMLHCQGHQRELGT